MASPQNSDKPAKEPRCPRCHHVMELSDSPVMLRGQAAQAEPPVWLCRHCWIVLPAESTDLRIFPSIA